MRICVIGGGAAGMMAAIAAGDNGHEVILFEKNEKLGKKLFLTGKGRCNLTNSCDTEELFQNIRRNPKFLYSAIYGFDNAMTMQFFEDSGLRIKEERGKRIFPISDHSSDVIATLSRRLKNANVIVKLNTEVVKINTDISENGRKISGVILGDGTVVSCDGVIMATGGMSYASTGSDGKSFSMLDDFSIDVTKLMPSLVPFECSDEYVTSLQGLSLKNVTLKLIVSKKEKMSMFGEMLFTHFGISGPLVLCASTYINDGDFDKGVEVSIDLKPALNIEELDKRILNDFNENQNKKFANALNRLLPSKIIPSVIELSNIDPDKKVNLITKQERAALVNVLKNFPVKVTGLRGFNEAIITRGGVSVKEINPSTMEAKKVKGLFFAGEMIDVDAYTGGYNLQIAWSTGHLAGESVN